MVGYGDSDDRSPPQACPIDVVFQICSVEAQTAIGSTCSLVLCLWDRDSRVLGMLAPTSVLLLASACVSWYVVSQLAFGGRVAQPAESVGLLAILVVQLASLLLLFSIISLLVLLYTCYIQLLSELRYLTIFLGTVPLCSSFSSPFCVFEVHQYLGSIFMCKVLSCFIAYALQ